MNTTRRNFLQRAGAGLGALTLTTLSTSAANAPAQSQPKKPAMRLGLAYQGVL